MIKRIKRNYRVEVEDQYVIADTTIRDIIVTLPEKSYRQRLTVRKSNGANKVSLVFKGVNKFEITNTDEIINLFSDGDDWYLESINNSIITLPGMPGISQEDVTISTAYSTVTIPLFDSFYKDGIISILEDVGSSKFKLLNEPLYICRFENNSVVITFNKTGRFLINHGFSKNGAAVVTVPSTLTSIVGGTLGMTPEDGSSGQRRNGFTPQANIDVYGIYVLAPLGAPVTMRILEGETIIGEAPGVVMDNINPTRFSLPTPLRLTSGTLYQVEMRCSFTSIRLPYGTTFGAYGLVNGITWESGSNGYGAASPWTLGLEYKLV